MLKVQIYKIKITPQNKILNTSQNHVKKVPKTYQHRIISDHSRTWVGVDTELIRTW